MNKIPTNTNNKSNQYFEEKKKGEMNELKK
jgi:hypothetical protein